MADCVQDHESIKVECNFNNLGDDFIVRDDNAAVDALTLRSSDQAFAPLAGTTTTLKSRATGPLVLHRLDSGDVFKLRLGGNDRVTLTDTGVMEFDSVDSGIVLPLLTTNPASPVEGLCFIFDDGAGTFTFRAYLGGSWRSSAAYTT